MAEATTCPDCGAALPADAPEGFCPQCLMRAGASSTSQAGELSSHGISQGFRVSLDDPAGKSAPLAVFGDYELLEEIARGGMGVVYKARQRSLNRIVAVKMILAGQFATKEFVKRFRAEAAAAAVLQHPNIVAIHEVGIHDGRHFFSMDYVEGHNLAQLVGQRPLLARQAARYLKQIAQAIHYAHEQGILHRDLKPSNVLIDSAADQPHITDFGLARRLDGESSLTVTGQVLGSPNFMPPEQTGEGHGKVGRHSDVYGLGAILYYLLTARPPFQGETLGATVAQVVNVEPIPPRVFNPAVPPDLQTICLKCLEKESSRRYPTARELAQELDRFLSDEPIVARPVSTLERGWRWCRRRPALATVAGIALALLFVIVLGAPIALVRIQAARVETERNLYVADMKLASEAARAGAYNHVRELLERHRPLRGQLDLRGFEWRYFWKVLQDHEAVLTLTGLPAPGWKAASLVCRGNFLYNQSGSELRAWDLNSWEVLPLAKPPQPIWVKWTWDPAEAMAYAVDNTNCTLTVYRLPKLDGRQVMHLPGPASAVATSPGGQVLAAAVVQKGEHRVLLWDLAKDVQTGELGPFGEDVLQIRFSPDKTMLGALYNDGTIGLWDLPALKALPAQSNNGSAPISNFWFFPQGKRLLLKVGNVRYSVWDVGPGGEVPFRMGSIDLMDYDGPSPGGDCVLASTDSHEIDFLDARTLQLVGALRGHLGAVGGCQFSRNGKLLATASVDQTARIWDWAAWRELAILGGFGERISDVAFMRDDQNVVLIGDSGKLKLYDWPKVVNSGLFAITPDLEGVVGIALSPDQRTLATRAVVGTVTLWDRTNRTPVLSFPLHDHAWGNLAFAPDGTSLGWVSSKALRVLSLDSGKIITFPVDGSGDRGDVAFSPDSAELAFACRTKLMLLELKSQRLEVFVPSEDEVVGVNYSPDGKLLAFGDRQGSVYLCDRQTRRIFRQPKVQPPHVYGVAFSPDGRLLATCSGASSLKLWEVGPRGLSWKADLHGHVGYIGGLTFSPDGTRLVTGSGDHTLKLWDVNQGVEVATLYGHTDLIGPPAFTRDGNTIYSCGFQADRQIRVWAAAPLDQVESNKQPNQRSP